MSIPRITVLLYLPATSRACAEEATMANDELTIGEVKRMAEEIGMTHLTEDHLQQLLHATNEARARRSALPVASLTPADEPAHVYRLVGSDER
jgi:hypothetical protein